MTKISVVIPTYNRSRYILSCLDSVLGQEGEDKLFILEVLVVDDGSTDNTQEVVKAYIEETKKNIRYFRIENSGGPAKPRNVGISKSNGDMVAFLDSDDIWEPSKLRDQLRAFKDPKVALCGTNASVIDSSGLQTKDRYLLASQGKSGFVFSDLVNDNFIITSSVLVSKKVLGETGKFSSKKAFVAVEDYDMWLRIAAQHQVAYIDKTLVKYRQHDENISKSDVIPAIKKVVVVLKSQLNNSLYVSQRQAVYRSIAQRLSDISSHSTKFIKLWYRFEAKAYFVLADRVQG